jgi:hypothetical protein
VESGSFLDRIMGWLDFGGDDDDSGNQEDSGGGGLGDVVDDVGEAAGDVAEGAQDAVDEVSEGVEDVADEVSEGDLGGAVDEAGDTAEDVGDTASDTVENVASGDADTGSDPDPSPEPTSDPDPTGGSDDSGVDVSVSDEVEVDTPSGSTTVDSSDDTDNDGTVNIDQSDLNQDPADQGQAGDPSDILNLNPADQGLPDSQEEVDQAKNFRSENFILSQATPGVDEALDSREQNLEALNQVESSIDQVEGAPENARFNFGDQTLTRDEALNKLENQQQSIEQAMQQNEQRFNEIQAPEPSQNNTSREEPGLVDQGIDTVEGFFETGAEVVQGGANVVGAGVNTFSDVTGIETPDAPETPEVGIPGTDFEVDVDNIWMGNEDQSGDLVLDSAADPSADPVQEFDNFSEDVRDTGLQVMEAGQGVGDRFAEVAPNTNEILLKGAGDVTGIEELNEAGEGVGDVTDSLQRGVGTVGTQAAGFFTAGAGSFGMLADDFVTDPIDTSQRFGAGTMQFVSQTGSQFTSSPVQFVAEEGGEEVSEAAIGALLAGPAGAAFGATPTVTPEPEVEPEFNPEVEPEAEPETTTEVEPEEETEFGPDEVTMEQLPSGFTQVQEVETNVEPVQTDLVEETAGVEVTRTGEGQTVYPDQPRAEEFDFQVGEETAGARATPTEPDRVNDPGEFRGEDPRTGFTDAEQEIVREVRQRDDVTIRQGDTIDETPPGRNEPDPDQTVIEAEETETGGELLFSVMGPVPPSLVEPETETEINPQPDIQGPDPELADVSPDVDVGSVGPEVEFEPETETEVRVEPETEVEPEVDQSVEPEFDPVIDQREETGQEFDQAQTQEFREEQAPEVTEDRPPEPGPDKIMDFAPEPGPEPFPDLRPEPEFEPEPDRTPDRDFGSEDSPFSREAPGDDQGGEAEPEFRPSLEAVLFDVEGEAPGDDEVLTGTEVRPIPEDMEDEFDFPF